ncbi:MAG: CrcB protein [Cycloclasticus pugetii]|jgi:CrcB protein|nr:MULTISPECIES: fluoride efflux transporter CrcB [Cycloclasticus]AFT67291.1 CrcB protein [Cycloclasticus sp. P1]AGS39503.1 CrcB protein [Cycloclasticus zancles 78-ME]ATI04156.1 fluoride efflux transporter CrcB [Cycloclasticus sp. PY97N]MBV1899403.1 fluoride efflux transporter CrcB [Cycloclasticus sp.]MDF1830298.1 fluoride efflux transporter CrcB [Cycloclasticus pugetii]|tara:strand:- start:1079 stop:1453 length:375 start_codon:yes stop_codon:yes gene_type:complete
MAQLLAIAAGGSVGAVMRFIVSTGIYSWLGRGFPYGTLVVNVIGSLLMGLLYELFLQRLSVSPEVRAVLLVGFLGAFTTFSTFSIETINLIEQGYVIKAIVNVLASVILCVLAAWVGLLIARQL